MTPMTDYDVYRSYLALRLHFTTDQYDVIKQQGRVKASKQAFYKRKDLFAIKKLADTFEDKEIVNFLVANFVSGDKWGGVFDIESKKNYVGWKKRIESMKYTFGKEVQLIVDCCDHLHIQFIEAFTLIKTHPLILQMYLRKLVSIETLVILNKINNFTSILDIQLKDDIIWPEVSRIIKKYSPFLNIDKEKYESIVRARTRCCNE
jgi:hypothetical protein